MILALGIYDWLLFGHILAAMVWLGGGVMLAAQATRVVRNGTADEVKRFLGSLRAIGPLVLAPATLGVVAFGVWMVLNSSAWSFDQRWVQVGLGLFAAAFLIGAVHQSRTAIAANRAATAGDATEAGRQLRRWLLGYALIVLLLVAAVWDMTNKESIERHVLALEASRVADRESAALDSRDRAVAGDSLERRRAGQFERTLVRRSHDRLGKRMFALPLDRRR